MDVDVVEEPGEGMLSGRAAWGRRATGPAFLIGAVLASAAACRRATRRRGRPAAGVAYASDDWGRWW